MSYEQKNYNLSENVGNSWNFTLNGKTFNAKYPTARDAEKFQEISTRLTKAKESKDIDLENEINKEFQKEFYSLINPVGHDTNIEDELRDSNIKVMQNFNEMIQTELAM